MKRIKIEEDEHYKYITIYTSIYKYNQYTINLTILPEY